jgi:PKD repeat protein
MKKLILSTVLMIVLVITAVASCSSNAEKMAEEEGIIVSSPDIEYPGGSKITGAPSGGAIDRSRDNDEGQAVYEESGDMATFGQGESATATTDSSYEIGEDRMIVRTGDMAMVVDDVESSIDSIKQLAETYEGWVVSSSMWKNGEALAGSISIRVLAEHFDSVLKALRTMAVEVQYENTSSRDVTEEYVDLSASLENLEATEQQLQVIMDKAETVEDILDVQRELTRVRGEIEQTKARMQYLEQTSSTSIIHIQLEESGLDINFTADKRRGIREGERIQFTLQEVSGGIAPYSYLWEFGDGETSTDENPSHSYDDSGYYTVSLTVTDDRGNTDTQVRDGYISVEPGWNAGSIASKAWNGLVTFGHVLGNILIWIGIFSPVWLIIGGLIFWRVRKRRQKESQ